MLKFIMKSSLIAVLGCAVLSVQAGTLDDVRAYGKLRCGVNTDLMGFAMPDDSGEWKGFDVDFCRAVATAVLGDNQAVKFVPLTTRKRLPALLRGEVDLLARNTTWTFSRDTEGVDFVGVNYYDGQAFMVPTSLGVKSAQELDGANVCVQVGTTTELNLVDYFNSNGIGYETVFCESHAECKEQFMAGRCDVVINDRLGLVSMRAGIRDPENYTILPEVIYKEPLALAVRHGDSQWADIVRWTLNAVINAEEMGHYIKKFK